MHSSIQFRHKATSTYRVEGVATVSDCTAAAHGLQTAICAEGFMLESFFFSGGQKVAYRYGMSSQELGTCQFSSISGLLNGGILLRVVCLFKFVSQTVSPVRLWKARSPTLSNTCHRDPFDLAVHRWPMGLDASVRPGCTGGWACWGSPETPDTFSSSLLLRQAALGFRFLSLTCCSRLRMTATAW